MSGVSMDHGIKKNTNLGPTSGFDLEPLSNPVQGPEYGAFVQNPNCSCQSFQRPKAPNSGLFLKSLLSELLLPELKDYLNSGVFLKAYSSSHSGLKYIFLVPSGSVEVLEDGQRISCPGTLHPRCVVTGTWRLGQW